MSGLELLGVLASGSVVERTVDKIVNFEDWTMCTLYLLYTLLCPLQILLHLLCGSHSVGKTCLCTCKSLLREGLQLEKFAVFSVQLARSAQESALLRLSDGGL